MRQLSLATAIQIALAPGIALGSGQAAQGRAATVSVAYERSAGLTQQTFRLKNASGNQEIITVVVGLRPDLTPGLRERPFRILLPKGWRHETIIPEGDTEAGRRALSFTCRTPDPAAADEVVAPEAECIASEDSREFSVWTRQPSVSLTEGPVIVEFADGVRVVASRRK